MDICSGAGQVRAGSQPAHSASGPLDQSPARIQAGPRGQVDAAARGCLQPPEAWASEACRVEVAARLDALTRLVVVHTGHGTFQARQMNFDVIISSLLQSSESE
ncbi:hypothetical protein VULLAG_LOCUS746 [Vulpes lagopus]